MPLRLQPKFNDAIQNRALPGSGWIALIIYSRVRAFDPLRYATCYLDCRPPWACNGIGFLNCANSQSGVYLEIRRTNVWCPVSIKIALVTGWLSLLLKDERATGDFAAKI